MAMEAPPSEIIPQPETELDETNITASLARLQETHVAVRLYRSEIGTWLLLTSYPRYSFEIFAKRSPES